MIKDFKNSPKNSPSEITWHGKSLTEPSLGSYHDMNCFIVSNTDLTCISYLYIYSRISFCMYEFNFILKPLCVYINKYAVIQKNVCNYLLCLISILVINFLFQCV